MNVNNLQSIELSINRHLSQKLFNKCMIDVGAHTGTFLKVFVQAGFEIYAFEPVPENRKRLADNFQESDKFHLFSEAVSNVSGEKDFYYAANQDGSTHEFYHSLELLPDDEYHKKGRTIKIKTVSLNDLISQNKLPGNVGYFKIDTEGHDLKVLEGASNLKSEVICVEFWSNKHQLGVSPSPPLEMIELMSERDYENFIIIKHESDGINILTHLFGFDDDSWGNILFFNDSNINLFKSTLEFCKGLLKNRKANSIISLLTKIFTEDIFFIDVGAYYGKFTDLILNNFHDARGYLFEPTTSSFEIMKNKYSNKSNIIIIKCALDSEKGRRTFYYSEDSTQNSLLPFVSSDIKFKQDEVETITLDDYFIDSKNINKIDLIKIDTQGNDLNVLKGGIKTIKKYRPAILMEIIFVQLYKNQGDYYEQIEFMKGLNYKLSGIYDIHFHESGYLAFADFLFLPKEKFEEISTRISPNSNFICPDVETILDENKELKAICRERLDLINYLSEEAQKRLDIINSLTAEIKRLKGKG